MKVLVAGATGLVGIPLVTRLVRQGEEVKGIVRSSAGFDTMHSLGAAAVTADVLRRDQLLEAVRGRSFDVVIHQLTALKKPPARFADMTATNELRTRGTTHLLALAREVGAHRFVTQSIVFGYGFTDHGPEPVTEDTPFGQSPGRPVRTGHRRAGRSREPGLRPPDVDGIALRYGLFYGRDLGTTTAMLRGRRLPVTRWDGPMAFVHHDDDAAAAVAAVTRGRADTAYTIVDDTPTSWRADVRSVASAVGAPPPFTLPGGLVRLVAPYAGCVHDRGRETAVERQGARRARLGTGIPLLRGGHRGLRLSGGDPLGMANVAVDVTMGG